MTPSVWIVAGIGVGGALALAYRGEWVMAGWVAGYFGIVCWMFTRAPFHPSQSPPPVVRKHEGRR